MSLPKLLAEVRGCQACAASLPHSVRPIVAAGANARVLIIGQAPGRRVHESGVAWQDASGDRLRDWMGVTPEEFYDPDQVALVPMGFCYPGAGKGGDLPPREECAPLWHPRLLPLLKRVRLTLLVGRYAQVAKLGEACGRTLTETVAEWRAHQPRYFPMPHPSPRNNRWLKQNPWFELELLPELRRRVRESLTGK